MIIEYNKFNVILYFLIGITISIGLKRWIYGSLIVLMSAFILLQTFILGSDSMLLKYQNITKMPSLVLLISIILVSLFVLGKSTIEGQQKLFSVTFLVFSLGYSFTKKYFKDKPIFDLSISNYIPSLLFMVFLLSISIIPDNQEIMEREYKGFKKKI